MAKKQSILQKKKRNYTNATLKTKKVFLLLKNSACDIIERCKLPQAIEPRKKSGYNHDNIMDQEETSIAEKK